MKGLALHTESVFEDVSKLECIKPYVLVGGTALSLQIGTRLSEDLDFMRWKTHRTEKIPINDLVSSALSYSGHKLKSKNLLAMLTNGSRFTRDAHFEQMQPQYTVSAIEIENYIKACLLEQQ